MLRKMNAKRKLNLSLSFLQAKSCRNGPSEQVEIYIYVYINSNNYSLAAVSSASSSSSFVLYTFKIRHHLHLQTTVNTIIQLHTQRDLLLQVTSTWITPPLII